MGPDERAKLSERARQANLDLPRRAVGVMKIIFPILMRLVLVIFVLGLFAR